MIDLCKNVPFSVYTLTPSFMIKEVYISGRNHYGFRSGSGKYYSCIDLFDNVEDAIEEGMVRLRKQKDRIEKQLSGMAKKRANLEKYKAAK